jgi:hypothetical protein
MDRTGGRDGKPPGTGAAAPAVVADEEEVAYLAKRHRVSPAVVREAIRRVGSAERAAVEREIASGKARR